MICAKWFSKGRSPQGHSRIACWRVFLGILYISKIVSSTKMRLRMDMGYVNEAHPALATTCFKLRLVSGCPKVVSFPAVIHNTGLPLHRSSLRGANSWDLLKRSLDRLVNQSKRKSCKPRGFLGLVTPWPRVSAKVPEKIHRKQA